MCAAVKANALPAKFIAQLAHIRHPTKLSALIHAETVPASAGNIAALERIAEVVGFDRNQIFIDGTSERTAAGGD